MKKVGILYMKFLGSHRGQSPANREELEKFLTDMIPNERTTMGIKENADVFRSSRDGADLVIRYGITVPPPGPGNPTVIAYEKKGVSGRYLVVYGTAGVEELTQARLKELVPDAKF